MGVFEVITHFNSISRQLPNYEAEGIVVANKIYKKQLTHAFRNEYIDDYYIANFDAKPYLIDYLRKNSIEKFLNHNSIFTIDEKNNYFITPFFVPDSNGKNLGYIIVFKDLKHFDNTELQHQKEFIIYITLLNILLVMIIAYFLINKNSSILLRKLLKTKNDELLNEKIYIQKVLDLDDNIIIVTSADTIKRANTKFLHFFGFSTLEKFLEKHTTICEFIIKIDDIELDNNKNINGIL